MLPVIITVVKVIQITGKAFVLEFACFLFTQMSFLWALPPTCQGHACQVKIGPTKMRDLQKQVISLTQRKLYNDCISHD